MITRVRAARFDGESIANLQQRTTSEACDYVRRRIDGEPRAKKVKSKTRFGTGPEAGVRLRLDGEL